VGLTPAAAVAASGGGRLCRPLTVGGPVFVTGACVDPVLEQPYVDVDRAGTTTDPVSGVTVDYRYIHGGFAGTAARFSLYFPAPGAYRGRFFESTYPTVTEEDATPGAIAFAISSGAYVVSTNNGGGVQAAGVLGGYRVNAASAKYSRVVAARVYATSTRPRGYIYGASGGAYQTIGAMENTSGVWDGGVPMVPGVPNAIPSFMTVELLALRVLGDTLPRIAAAMAPGGSGDPYAGLTAEQRAVLREVTRLGFPLRGWWQYATLNGGAYGAVEAGVRALDPTYADDFWSKPGYEGADPAVLAARVRYDTAVTGLVGSPASGVVLASVPTGQVAGADLVVTGGAAAGKTVPIGAVTGGTLTFGTSADPSVTGLIRPGDSVRIDNSWLIASEYYQRHQLPTADEYGWNQYRAADGTPAEPQRAVLAGPLLAAGAAGGPVTGGRFSGKMIMLASTMDVQAYPWSADWYRAQAQAAYGASLNGGYRLWYMENADHDPTGPAATTAAGAADHIVSYDGELQQALLDLDAWVTRGTPPPAGTSYHIDANDQVRLASTAAQRHGLQPVVTLSASAACARSGRSIVVPAGTPVTFTVEAQAPDGAGRIVRVEWDFQGTGAYPVGARPAHIGSTVTLRATYAFTTPGTYTPVVRVTSQRNGDPEAPYGLIQNLAGVRVVVR
jgi:hypothetical protein